MANVVTNITIFYTLIHKFLAGPGPGGSGNPIDLKREKSAYERKGMILAESGRKIMPVA